MLSIPSGKLIVYKAMLLNAYLYIFTSYELELNITSTSKVQFIKAHSFIV